MKEWSGGMGEKKYNGMVWPYWEDEEWRVCEKKKYVSEIEGHSRKGKPLERWKDKVKEYVSERDTRRGGGMNDWMKHAWHCNSLGNLAPGNLNKKTTNLYKKLEEEEEEEEKH